MLSKVFAVAALASAVTAAGVTADITPTASAPSGCSTNYSGEFEIKIVNASSTETTSNDKRDTESTPLISTLVNGQLHDEEGRTGYIASNNQFQYDDPPQAGAIYTGGFSVCANGTLALGDSTIFYECLSGTFYNLYDESEGAQCSEVFIDVVAVSNSSTTTTSASGDVTQISDGQIQAATTTAGVVTQISDGQVQAATSTAGVVTQISDGQVQAATTTAAAASASATVVSQISDGQIQAATNASTVASATPVPYTGAASSVSVGIFSVVAGLLALAAL